MMYFLCKSTELLMMLKISWCSSAAWFYNTRGNLCWFMFYGFFIIRAVQVSWNTLVIGHIALRIVRIWFSFFGPKVLSLTKHFLSPPNWVS